MASSTVPTIHISPAPPQEHLPEPYSPFRNLSFLEPQIDAFRPTHLSPPPIHASFRKHLSPLCPPDTPLSNKGLERQRFEALLRASKERNALVGAKKAVDLRKEIVHKAHQSKLGMFPTHRTLHNFLTSTQLSAAHFSSPRFMHLPPGQLQ